MCRISFNYGIMRLATPRCTAYALQLILRTVRQNFRSQYRTYPAASMHNVDGLVNLRASCINRGRLSRAKSTARLRPEAGDNFAFTYEERHATFVFFSATSMANLRDDPAGRDTLGSAATGGRSAFAGCEG